jgi:hypothetical protein
VFPGVGSKTIGAATLAVVLAAAPTSVFALCQELTLDIRFAPSAGSSNNWCWAASGQMIMQILGEAPSVACQCRQAEAVLGVEGCCSPSSSCVPVEALPSRCDQPRWPAFIERPDLFAYDYRTTCDSLPGRQNDDSCEARPLPWTELVREICARRPVIASLRPPGSTKGHTVVVKGISSRPSPRVLVVDPARVCPLGRECEGELDESLWLSYEEYAAGWGGMVHWVDFFGIRKR